MNGNKSQIISSKLFRFKELSKLARPFFKLENIELNFSGYEQMLREYESMDVKNLRQSFTVTRDLLLWIDYLQELRCVIHASIMKLENRRLYLEAFKSDKRSPKLEAMIADTHNNRSLCSYYEKELMIQIKFLNFAYKNAITEYNDNIRK